MTHSFDVAIVLGARLRDDGAPSSALVRRVDHACALFHRGAAARLLLSGGGTGGPWPEAEAMRRLALAAGVPAAALLLETGSRNTVENAVFSLRLLGGDCRRLVVVTDRYHLPRSLLIFRRLGADPAGSSPAPASRWHHARGLGREAVALPLTLWRLRRP